MFVAGNVAVVDDREAGRIEVVADGAHASAGDRRADGAPVEHAGKDEIVGVLRGAGCFSDAVFARDALAYGSHFGKITIASVPGKLP